MILVLGLWTFLRAVLTGSAAVALENLALRHQLAVLQRSGHRPRLSVDSIWPPSGPPGSWHSPRVVVGVNRLGRAVAGPA
jgi:hypothetical protein